MTEGPILGESGSNFDTRDQIVSSLHFTLFLAWIFQYFRNNINIQYISINIASNSDIRVSWVGDIHKWLFRLSWISLNLSCWNILKSGSHLLRLLRVGVCAGEMIQWIVTRDGHSDFFGTEIYMRLNSKLFQIFGFLRLFGIAYSCFSSKNTLQSSWPQDHINILESVIDLLHWWLLQGGLGWLEVELSPSVSAWPGVCH